MRIVRYSVINTQTKKAIYTDCRIEKCRAFFDGLESKENFAIVYRWVSI